MTRPLMIDRIDIIEAVAKSVDVPLAYVHGAVIDATLDALLPLIKARLASKVRGGDIKDPWPQDTDAYSCEEWFDIGMEYAAQLIERFEL